MGLSFIPSMNQREITKNLRQNEVHSDPDLITLSTYSTFLAGSERFLARNANLNEKSSTGLFIV